MNKNKLQVAIYLSALLLSLGVFLPLTSFPLYGEVSYFRMAWIEASLVIGFALMAPALILAGKEKWIVVPTLAVWVVLLYPTLKSYVQSRNNRIITQIGSDISSAMTNFVADLLLNITEFHWGGFVFLFALLVFTASSLLYLFRS